MLNFSAPSFASFAEFENCGMIVAANTAMITTTINTSIRVKPLRRPVPRMVHVPFAFYQPREGPWVSKDSPSPHSRQASANLSDLYSYIGRGWGWVKLLLQFF